METSPEAPQEHTDEESEIRSPGFFWRTVRAINIGHLLLLIFALHLFALSFPSDTSNGGGKVFDEAYYVPASLDLLHGVVSNLEHPFFGKLWGALGIAVFGDNFFGWRILYAVIGTLAVGLMYKLARQFFSKEKALLAASLLAFENLFFVHTSLLLLDGPPVLFALAGFLAYFKRRYYLSAVAFGLCVLSKESGIFFVLALLLYHLWANARTPRAPGSLRKVLIFAIVLTMVVAVPLWGYDNAYHPKLGATVIVQSVVAVDQVHNSTVTTTETTTSYSETVTEPVQNFLYYFTYQSSFKGCGSTDQWNCYPWNWVLPFNVSPLQYYVTSVTVSSVAANGTILHTAYHPVDWVGMGNLVIWYSIWLVVPIVAWGVVGKRPPAREAHALVACLIAGTYLPLFYISLVSHRVEYAFYFINTDVGLALGIPLVVTFLARGRSGVERLLILLWFVAAVAFFLAYFPVDPFAFGSSS